MHVIAIVPMVAWIGAIPSGWHRLAAASWTRRAG
jgi:hypothetical protein